jgi:predicted SnoaL-like aldol condensation-catalyzing enzyme
MTDLMQTPGTRDATQSENARLAVDFLKSAVAGKAVETMEHLAAPEFVHHNPYFAQGADTLAAAMDEDARSDPGKVLDVQRTIAEGPFVAVHSRLRRPSGLAMATVHIFRIEDGRIRELWDIAQEAPADSPNPDGMF